ncbi:unnamed protein product [Cladocopium goreaui]|uniref:Uncharacterized protein n=1 Tax=Cladocopium goreaui TaxID=2562237 RepID=A0A9P1DFC7_9DINO|nr:unnamed protein product [Cladocopium goreaui]
MWSSISALGRAGQKGLRGPGNFRARQFSEGPQVESDNRGISTNVAVLVPLALTAFIVLKDALPETPKKVEKDEVEERLKQELQNTSFKEWKAAGFEPEKRQ